MTPETNLVNLRQHQHCGKKIIIQPKTSRKTAPTWLPQDIEKRSKTFQEKLQGILGFICSSFTFPVAPYMMYRTIRWKNGHMNRGNDGNGWIGNYSLHSAHLGLNTLKPQVPFWSPAVMRSLAFHRKTRKTNKSGPDFSPKGSMGLVYLPTWMVDFYGKCR